MSITEKQIKLRKLTVSGLMSALAVVLVLLIHFPILPPPLTFLEYDAGDIPLFLLSMVCGPWYGLCATVVASIVQGVTVSAQAGWIGIVMHIFGTGSYILAQGFVLGRLRLHTKPKELTIQRSIVATVVAIIAMLLAMGVWNLLFTPIYMKIPRAVLLDFYPGILLFNLIKGGVNGVLSLLLYLALRPVLKRSHWM